MVLEVYINYSLIPNITSLTTPLGACFRKLSTGIVINSILHKPNTDWEMKMCSKTRVACGEVYVVWVRWCALLSGACKGRECIWSSLSWSHTRTDRIYKNKNKIMVIYIWVRLMCALKIHIKFFIFRKIFSKIEKAVITFSILEKFFFQKWKLMCA